jgi:NAD(P)-dependent dehydrogenase (short-subunit alcohol dehydrogenase family)
VSPAPLAGQTALVVGGGASIGLATAHLLARDGASVVLMGLDGAQLATAASSLREHARPDAVITTVTGDATSADDVARAVAAATALPGRFTMAVGGVGRTTMAPMLAYRAEEIAGDVDVNVVSAWLLVQHAARAMIPTGGGAIALVSSHAAAVSFRLLGSYCATKAGLEAFARVAADELGGHGVRVNVVRPGLTRREAASPIFGDGEMEQRYAERTPLIRPGVADDSAHALRHLVGPESSWTTGQCLTVDGGLTLRGAPDMEPVVRRTRGDAIFATRPLRATPAPVHEPPGSDPDARGGALAGRVALVTGGGSSIGLACAAALLVDGARVVIAGRDTQRLDRAATDLARRHGARVGWVQADVTDTESVAALVAGVLSWGQHLDICVASAGGAVAAPVLDATLDEMRRPFTLNLVGTHLTLAHAAAAMTRGGSIVAISSHSSTLSFRGLAGYCASKAALDMLVRVAADELGERGVRVNAVRPGLTRRDAPSPILDDPIARGYYDERTPLGRQGVPDDTAEAVRFLAGPESSWVTGQCLTVDGGLTLRGAPDLAVVMERFNRIVHGEATPRPRGAAS